MGEAADVFGGVEAELDVGAVLGRRARREELDQLDGFLEQGVAVAAEELPVAVGAVDGHRAEGRAELDQGLHVDQRLLGLEAVVLLGVGAFAVLRFEHAGVQVLEVPVHGDRSAVVVVVDAQVPLRGGLFEFIVLPPVEVGSRDDVRLAALLRVVVMPAVRVVVQSERLASPGVSLLRRAGLSRCASSHRGTGVSPLTGFHP